MSTVDVSKTNSRERLKEFRKHVLRMSLEDFAKTLGFSLGYVHAIEAGRREVSQSFVAKLKTIHQLNPAWLTEGVGDPLGSGESNPTAMTDIRSELHRRNILVPEEVQEGVVPERKHFIGYIDSVLESAEGDDEKLKWGYLKLRHHLPRFSDDWNTDFGRYREILRAASDLASATFPDDEKEQADFFDQTVLIAAAKSSLGSRNPEMRELARSYLSDLLEGESEKKEAQEQTANN